MVNLDKLLNIPINRSLKQLANGKSLLDDLSQWVDNFMDHTRNQHPSKNTQRSYEFTLRELVEFVNRYYREKDSLSDFDAIMMSQYMSWLEQYHINKQYGSLSERLVVLMSFIEQNKEVRDYASLLKAISDFLEDSYSSTADFELNMFAEWYSENEYHLAKTSNSYIENYIVFQPKASNKTIVQRYIVLGAFCKYVDKITKTSTLMEEYKAIKHYKLAKETDEHRESIFTVSQAEAVVKYLFDLPRNPSIYLKRVIKDAQWIAYRDTFLIAIMMGAGLRAGEALKVKASDFQKRNNGTYAVRVKGGKGNKNRTTYIKVVLIEEHLDFLSPLAAGRALSIKPNGTEVTRSHLYEVSRIMFNRIDTTGELHLRGMKGLHIFRHHFGSTFAEKNGNMVFLRDMLGHVNIGTTMIYSKVSEEAKSDAIARL